MLVNIIHIPHLHVLTKERRPFRGGLYKLLIKFRFVSIVEVEEEATDR
jgi:hypothetical protein